MESHHSRRGALTPLDHPITLLAHSVRSQSMRLKKSFSPHRPEQIRIEANEAKHRYEDRLEGPRVLRHSLNRLAPMST